MNEQADNEQHSNYDIAIIGMSGRFPGAPDLETFWRNLRDGVESITFFTDEELKVRGVPDAYLRAPNFVKAAPILEGIEQFEAPFFGYAPREAQLLDPQHRLLLECAWEALEKAGYNPYTFPGLIGVFAGTSLSTYLLFNLMTNPTLSDGEHSFEVMISNDKDFIGTRISYHLNLRGPSLDVQTGCSTSLVATHLACEALLSFQCDIALAGGVSVNVPQRTGYFYEEGGITSPDGHCRAFDAAASGTLFGSGAGIVVLKRLDDALRDRDTILAVIKSSAVNNDGSLKIGYTAPSVDGQAEVIARALALAEIDPATIQYVETHGTGTALGDPIEVTALTRTYRASTDAKQFCGLGAVKSNIGHLDAAAGVAGLIKTVLALHHKQIPPSLHFQQPNPKLDLENSPFYVNDTLQPWPRSTTPARAGVSSFGIGGTNAHLILEEAPAVEETATGEAGRYQLILLSARTETALSQATTNLVQYWQEHPSLAAADVAYTLQVGRKRFNYRRALVCQGRDDALARLEQLPPQDVFTAYEEAHERPIVFMFPGGGAQYLEMGRDLYEQETAFREVVDECAAILKPLLGYDIRGRIYPQIIDDAAAEQFKDTGLALPALFTVSYATARLLMAWGIKPAAMIGHSLGEYVAAALSGVFSLADALALVVRRGYLFEQLPEGAMISVPLAAAATQPFMNEQLSFAAINGPGQCVVAGPVAALEQFTNRLDAEEIEYRRLPIHVAAHSVMVEPLVEPFSQFVATLPRHEPQIPFISNVTGTWLTAAEATDPNYWGQHLRQTVQFGAGISTLLAEPGYVFVEIGPGRTLSALARFQASKEQRQAILSTLRHPYDQVNDNAFLLATLGKLWLAGVTPDWQERYGTETPRRVPLPTYPFERQRYWIEPGQTTPAAAAPQGKLPDISDWFYTPTWQKTALRPRLSPQALSRQTGRWLIFDDGSALGQALTDQLRQAGQEMVQVTAGTRFYSGHSYTIRPDIRADYDALIRELAQQDKMPERIIHLWGMIEIGNDFAKAQDYGFYSLLYLTQAVQSYQPHANLALWIMANGLYQIESQDILNPHKTTVLGPATIIPQEHEPISCHTVDVMLPAANRIDHLAHLLLSEIIHPPTTHTLAYRGWQRWERRFVPLTGLDEDTEKGWSLRPRGTYLITGGLGNVGLQLAAYLAQQVQARLVLVGRSPFPAREAWPDYLAQPEADDSISQKIRKLQAIEAAGGSVMTAIADVANLAQMQAVLTEAEAQFGSVHGVIHAAGMAGETTITLIPDLSLAECERHFQAKVHGTQVLHHLLQGRELDFVLLFSSNVSVLGGLGATAYAAANYFLDSFAAAQEMNGKRWISANWDGWLGDEQTSLSGSFRTSIDQFAMHPSESSTAFARIVTQATTPQVIVSTGHLPTRLDLWINRTDAAAATQTTVLHPRPQLDTAYVAPENELQAMIADIWRLQLGVDELGIHDNFFDLGGNSLIALKVISRLKKELQRDIPVVSLFEGPTISTLAELLSQQPNGHKAYEESRSRGEQRRQRRQQPSEGFYPI